MDRYRLVYPYDSNNIYIANNVMKAADKCYSELVHNDKNNPFFCIMNIDTNKIFNFEIPKRQNIQNGGNKETSNELDGIMGTSTQKGGDEENPENDEEKITAIEKQIEELQRELHNLKGTVLETNKKDRNSVIKAPSNIYNDATFRLTEMDQLENYEKKDECVIM